MKYRNTLAFAALAMAAAGAFATSPVAEPAKVAAPVAAAPLDFKAFQALFVGAKNDAALRGRIVGKTVRANLEADGPDALLVKDVETRISFTCKSRAPGYKQGMTVGTAVAFQRLDDGYIAVALDRCSPAA